MKILIIITRGDTIGGAQTHVSLIAKKLQDDGHDVNIVFGGEVGPFADLLKDYNIQYFNIPSFSNKFSLSNDIKSFIKIRRLIKLLKPDLISLHSTKAGILGRFIGKSLRLPVVLTVHGWSFSKGIPLPKRIISAGVERLFSFMVNKFILVSYYDLNIAKKLKFKESKLNVVHNGVEDIFVKYKDEILEHKPLSIVMVARFDNQKNQKFLINVCKDISDISLNFIGDGPLLEETKSYSKQLNSLCEINYYGLRLDAKEIIKEHDVFALISNWEGFPISTIEAMSIGLPIIVSDVGGAAECVENNVNGFVIQEGDADYLLESISQLKDNKLLVKDFGLNSRQIYLNNFTDKVMYEKTISIFKSIINKDLN